MAWSRAEDEVRTFIERTQLPFLRSPMGKGVMPDDHPLSVAAARTLALQNAHWREASALLSCPTIALPSPTSATSVALLWPISSGAMSSWMTLTSFA
jgi:hypothetical protein